MLDIQKLNEKIAEITVDNISWIAEENEDGNWECFAAPDRAEQFCFDFATGKFADEAVRWWNDFRIEDSAAHKEQYNVILSGCGTAYDNN